MPLTVSHGGPRTATRTVRGTHRTTLPGGSHRILDPLRPATTTATATADEGPVPRPVDRCASLRPVPPLPPTSKVRAGPSALPGFLKSCVGGPVRHENTRVAGSVTYFATAIKRPDENLIWCQWVSSPRWAVWVGPLGRPRPLTGVVLTFVSAYFGLPRRTQGGVIGLVHIISARLLRSNCCASARVLPRTHKYPSPRTETFCYVARVCHG